MEEVNTVANYMIFYINNRDNNEIIDEELFKELCCYIAESLSYWSGQIYVGKKKDKTTEDIFQKFFKNLNYLIRFLSNNEFKLMKIEKDFINIIRYNGKVYRFLGHSNLDLRNCKKIIKPKYNNIWVSWSKEKNNSYLESKLYGKKTRLYCDIKDCYYGIDLEEIQKFCNKNQLGNYYISRGTEKEVVFPTIKKLIYKVEYL